MVFTNGKFYAPSIYTNTYDYLIRDKTNIMTNKTATKIPRAKKTALANQNKQAESAKEQSEYYAKIEFVAFDYVRGII